VSFVGVAVDAAGAVAGHSLCAASVVSVRREHLLAVRALVPFAFCCLFSSKGVPQTYADAIAPIVTVVIRIVVRA
jgi:hypothetical protein